MQDPKPTRLVLTLFDEDVVGGREPIGSVHQKLTKLLPATKTGDDAILSPPMSTSFTSPKCTTDNEVTPLCSSDLPDDDDTAESIMAGGGDATLDALTFGMSILDRKMKFAFLRKAILLA